MRATLVREARSFFDVDRVALLGVAEHSALVDVRALDRDDADGPQTPIDLLELPCVGELIRSGEEVAQVAGEAAAALAERLDFGDARGAMLLAAAAAADDGETHVLVLAREAAETFSADDALVVTTFARATAAALARLRLAAERAAQTAQNTALTRAAQVLHEPLDLPSALTRIALEATSVLAGDRAAVLLADDAGALEIVAAHKLPAQALGRRLPPDTGLAGRIVRSERAMYTNDHGRMATPPLDAILGPMRSAIGVPLHWDGKLRGVLAIGCATQACGNPERLRRLEPFGALAALACRDAERRTRLAAADQGDPLRAWLAPDALDRILARELEHATAGGHPLTLVLVRVHELPDAEADSTLVHAEVLRRIGFSLRAVSRREDHVAHCGGDRFAIVAVGANAREAAGIARRALERLPAALDETASAGLAATAALAEWDPRLTAAQLVERAETALDHGCEHRRGRITCWGKLAAAPDGDPGDASAAASPRAALPSRRATPAEVARYRKRTRQLRLIGMLSTRLATLDDAQAIAAAAADELHRALGHYLCTIARIRPDGYVEPIAASGESFVRHGAPSWCEPRDAGLIGRCLRERRVVSVTRDPVASVHADPPASASESSQPRHDDAIRAQLVAPILAGGRLWGAIDLHALRTDAFAEDDAQVLQTVAEQVGAALHIAELRARPTASA